MYTENFISSQELNYALSKGVTLNIGALDTLKQYKEQLKGKSIYVRINPKVGAGTSYHVITGGPKSKFGVYEDDIDQFIQLAKDNDIHIKGLHQHIGSNLKKHDEEVFLETLDYVASLLPKFSEASYLNIGGGLGVAYKKTEQLSDP
jgi:diaminopimelate decarboxylase